MKRTYEKPGLFIENFALAQSIAVACGASHSTVGSATNGDHIVCGWDPGTGVVIWTTAQHCSKIVGNNQYNGLCYNNLNSSGIFGNS